MSYETFPSAVCLSFVQQEEIGKIKKHFQENIPSIYFLLFPLSPIDPFHASVS